MNKKERQHSARFVAVEVLSAIEQKGAYSNLLLNEKIAQGQVLKQDSSLLTQLVYGVLQHKLLLDFFIKHYVKRPNKLENWVRQLLRLSIYQLQQLDQIPDHAVLHEAVEIAKMKGHRGISGLVNGVLRNVLRKGVPDPTNIKNKYEQYAVIYNLPVPLVKKLVQQMGEDRFGKLGKSLEEHPRLSMRVNTKYLNVEEAIAALQKEGYKAKPSAVAPAGIIGHSGLPTATSLFKAGQLTIQDESSMLVAEVLDIKPYHQVLDTCAAPGGKTTHIAQFLAEEKSGQVTALDIHAHKVDLIRDQAKRMHLEHLVTARQADSTKLSEYLDPDQQFDRVLVDAPCSGLGLIRRKPEIRYRKTLREIKALQNIQQNILTSAAPFVKLGGNLIYSTCTILDEENKATIQKFLGRHPGFVVDEIQNPALEKLVTAPGTIKLYPQDFGTDGFFIQKLKKVSDE